MSDPKPLVKPIQAHGEELTELTLRRPTVQEVRAIRALPYKIGADEAVMLDMDAGCKYIAVCAGIPASSVNQLELTDLNDLAWEIAGFFMKQPSTTPTTS